MDITWVGHAAFQIRSGNAALLMDPFGEELGLRVPPQQSRANLVTVSNDSGNHNASDVATGDAKPVILDGPGEYEVSGLHLRGIRTSRYTPEGAPQAWNTVFVIEVEGMLLCHLGDPDRLLTAREVEELGSPHVLLLPVGSKQGLTTADAVEVVNSISPRIVVPMLFAHPGNKTDLRELGPFLQELGAKAPERQNRLTVTRANLPEETTVALLQPSGTMI